MKKIFLLMIIIGVINHNLSAQSNLSGKWSDDSKKFSLELKQNGNTISGMHCCVMQSGNKIDCADDEISIKGSKNGDNYKIVFTSSYSGTQGVAVLTVINPRMLKWQIISKPSGEFYVPVNALLLKK